MSHVFKSLYEDSTDFRRFGICDDRPHQRAYINTNDGGKWIAVVSNNYRKPIVFTAFDNCIEFRTKANKLESRCEGAITYENVIIFVEAKERKGKTGDWAKDAEDQLKATIESVSKRVDLDFFQIKRAAICNKLRTKNNEKHTARIKKFLKDTGYILTVDNRIIID